MRNIFIFSDKLRPFANYLRFQLLKLRSGIIVLCKQNKALEKIEFDYYKEWHFDNAYLVVEFQFKNALWFRIGNFRSAKFDKRIVLNIQNVDSETLPFEVFGLNQKQTFQIQLQKELTLETGTFKTRITNHNRLKLQPFQLLSRTPKIGITPYIPIVKRTELRAESKPVQMKYNQFKTEDFI